MKMQPKNYLCSGLFLILLVTIIFLGLTFVPTPIGNVFLKSIDFLSDLRGDTTENSQNIIVYKDSVKINALDVEMSSVSTSSVKETIQYDSFGANDSELGLVRFEDFSENKNGLGSFFEKLLNIKSLGRPVRIAYIGDSIIEGDILSGDLRRKFHKNFGGRGVGMMPVTSQVSNFRKTVIHQFNSWNTHKFNNYNKSKLGLGGIVCTPNKNAWVYYQGVKREYLDSCERVSIFYSLPNTDTRVYYKKNKGTSYYTTLPKAEHVGRIDIDGKCGDIQISFPELNQLHVYGVSLEDTTGVIVDNYSIRGFSGTGLQNLSPDKLSQFNNLLKYDLIILGFGLNVTETQRVDYKAYEAEMVKTIKFLQTSFPSTSFLLIGVPDRSYKNKDNYETMPGVMAMVEHQKRICENSGIVFWNLYEAMGGKNSMPLFVNSNPPKASKDYTHLTFEGGEYLGSLLYETFMYEKDVYEKKSLQTLVK